MALNAFMAQKGRDDDDFHTSANIRAYFQERYDQNKCMDKHNSLTQRLYYLERMQRVYWSSGKVGKLMGVRVQRSEKNAVKDALLCT